jgi:hypothetical protein
LSREPEPHDRALEAASPGPSAGGSSTLALADIDGASKRSGPVEQ